MRNSDFEEKTPIKHFCGEKKIENWNDLTGLRKHKAWVDEKYQDLGAFLSDNQTKVSKNTGKHP
jgi:hypothetical protein